MVSDARESLKNTIYDMLSAYSESRDVGGLNGDIAEREFEKFLDQFVDQLFKLAQAYSR